MGNWIIYPTKLLEEIAKRYGYDIGEFLCELGKGTLPNDIKIELDKIKKGTSKNVEES